MEGLQLHTSVTEHSGGEGNWFVTVGFDNHKIGDAGMDARYRILHEMIALGRALWRSFDFLEGYLGREDEGPFVTLWESASRDQLWNQLPRASFAAFLGRAVSDRLSLTSWARGLRPPPRIEGFKPEGTLMIWDDSPRAAANFLETLG
jgi:hypothetical protein